jgi:2-polyprenyl-3-methyl-5-hydroxy-6-metoxy-1,4-benzoquinol methylase
MDTTTTIRGLVDNIAEQYPVHRGFLTEAIDGATPEELDRLDRYVAYCLDKGLTLDYLAESYLTILGDTLDEQMYFREHGRYRHSTFAEVAESVYHDRDYMDRYMYGLALTNFLWPNHLEMARFLRRTLPRERRGRYLEVGPGHGFLLLSAVEVGSFDEMLAVDLSAASVEQTRSIIEHFHPDAPARVEQRDFLEAADLEPSSFDAVVMGEVLEHVERPDVFLRRIAELATDDAYVFITTCINAPAVDHIYLWRTTDELEQMITDNGLRIVEPLRLPYEGKTLEESRAENLPINVAYVLARA